MRFEDGSHLLLDFVGPLGGYLGEAFCGVGIDDGAAAVDDESAVVVPSIAAHVFKAAALSANTWNEEEMVGRQTADVGKGAALGGADDVHQEPSDLPVRGGVL